MTARPVLWVRLAVVAAATAVGLLGTVVLATPASAHAILEHSTPVDGSRVDREPAAVVLTFDEAVQAIPASDEVISTTGERVETGVSQSSDAASVVLALRPGLPTGTYTAVWRVVSADTHIVSGSITFGLGVDPSVVPLAAPNPTSGLDVAADVADGLVYLGVVLLAGVGAAVALWWPWVLGTRRVRVAVRGGWLLAVVGTAGALLLQGPRALDAGWAGVVRLAGIDQTFGAAFGWELAARIGVLLLSAPLMTTWWLRDLRSPGRAAVSLAAGLALLVTVALTGHESVGTAVPLAMIAAVLHLGAMALWLGGLTALGTVVLPATRAGAHPLMPAALRRWSVAAYCCVSCLVITGEYMASRQLAPVQALWSTAYGVVLMVKLALIAGMVAAAALAQRRIQAALPVADGRAAPGTVAPTTADVVTVVRRSVRVESALAVLVLAATTVLVSQPPGNTTYGPPAMLAAPLGHDSVRIGIDATLRGRQQFVFDVLGAAGAPAPVQSVTVTLSSPTVASLALRLSPATPGADGSSRWSAAPVIVPQPGVWTINVHVGIDQADAYATTAVYRVW